MTKKKGKILIVDDEEDVRDIMKAILEGEGFEVDTSANGLEALDKYKASLDKNEPFDVVITDLMMPVMDGLKLIEELQKLDKPPLTIVITGFGTIDTAVKALKIGAYDYVLKPFKIGDILSTIERGLESERLKEENILLKDLINIHRMVEDIGSYLDIERVLDTFRRHSLSLTGADAIAIVSNGNMRVYPEDQRMRNALKEVVENIKGDEKELIVEEDIKRISPELLEMGVKSILVNKINVENGRPWFILLVFKKYPNWDYVKSSAGILFNRFAASVRNALLYEKIRDYYHRTILSFARAIEAKDPYTRGHSERVAFFSAKLGEAIGLPKDQIETLKMGGVLHDIGKIGIKDTILKKPSTLTSEEYEEIKKHPAIGRQIVEPIDYFREAIPIIYQHHERFDGRGYPEGIKGEEIPLLARITSLADAYEAMTSDRAYRKALSREIALEEIRKNKGKQFDPDLAEEFIKMVERDGF